MAASVIISAPGVAVNTMTIQIPFLPDRVIR